MKRTLKMVEAELKVMNLYLESVPKWYRNSSSLKGTKQFYVKGGGEQAWTGSDGESNYSPRVCVRIAVKSVSDITIDMIKSEYAKTHAGKNIEDSIKVALVEQQKEDERIAILRAEYEAEKAVADAAEKVAKERIIDTVEISERMVSFNDAIETDDAIKLAFFRTEGVICSNDYREEFLALVHNVAFQKLVLETISLSKACFDYGFELKLGRETNRRNIEHFSIGGPKKAFEYLTKDWK